MPPWRPPFGRFAFAVAATILISIALVAGLAFAIAPLIATSSGAETAALFVLACCTAGYFGVNACGSWLATPLIPMLLPRNRRHFGGMWSVLRHAGLLALWSVVLAAYSLVLFELLRAAADQTVVVATSWSPFGWKLDRELVESGPRGRALVVWLVSTVLCLSARRAERIDAVVRGEQWQLLDGTEFHDADSRLNGAINRLPYARVAVGFLVPIYRELRRKRGLMESATFNLIVQEFSYEKLKSAADKLASDTYYGRVPAVLQMSAELAAISFGEASRDQTARTQTIVSSLNIMFGYYGAREIVVSFAAERSRRHSHRVEDSVVVENVCVKCATHGDAAMRISDYCVDGSGLGLCVSSCLCFAKCRNLKIGLNEQLIEAEIRHSTTSDSSELRLGVAFQPGDWPLVKAMLRQAGASV